MTHYSLPLFPLNVVIFPEGLLPLRIFEMRYLDMVSACLRNKTPFGVVAVYSDSHAENDVMADEKERMPFAKVGTSFNILDAEVTTPGLITIRCLGQHKFHVKSAAQQKNGLWIGEVEDIANEPSMQIPDDLQITKVHLQRLIEALSEQDLAEIDMPIGKPYKMNECGWVANRWCEIINIPLVQKQRMLELDSPLVRLELVQDILATEFSAK
ncbi:MAG TPA: LON peptidase substrate-binding domain-containing protein [Methylotenera sp.]|nr:LON peptidase substrate-binding domain-containing protein [Methylotenera sp.]